MKLAVIGAGNGGHAMAAHLTAEGHEVVLFSRTRAKLDAIAERGGIALSGLGHEQVVRLAGATDDMAEALDGAELAISTVPGMVQRDYVELLVPQIASHQALWFCPGNAMSLITRPLLEAAGKGDVLLIESSTLTYAVRMDAPASVKVTHLLKTRCAAFPSERNAEALELVRQLYPLPEAPNVLDTTLNNVNPMIHVIPALLNRGAIDASDGYFSIYGEGMTESVLRAMDALDAERLALLSLFGLDVLTLEQLYDELGCGPIYRQAMGVGKAERYETRFLSEDVPVGLSTMADLGRRHGVPTPLTEGLISLACAVDGVDYTAGARGLDQLGLDGMSVERVGEYLTRGA
jgi:opine dehydrogenase